MTKKITITLEDSLIEELAEENLELKVCKLNVDEASDIARKYEIESIPTLIYFNNGMALKTLVGLRTKQDILNTIKEFEEMEELPKIKSENLYELSWQKQEEKLIKLYQELIAEK